MIAHLCVCSIRYAAGYDDPTSGANVFFWFMHAVTLTLHGQ